MKVLWNDKDGGPESHGWAWGIEIKWLGSLLLLLFREGSRDAFHSHAFNSVSWLLTGWLREKFNNEAGPQRLIYPSWHPIVTRRETQHKVFGMAKRSWVLTFRGPWADRWSEYRPNAEKRFVTLTHGRKEVA